MRRKPLKSVVSLVSKTVRGSHVNMMKENLHFCVLETDFKKFVFTTVEATTEVLLIKQKKGLPIIRPMN